MSENSLDPSAIDSPVPHLLDSADKDELTLNVGLGLVARKAAEAEYVLHGIHVHLADVEKAYSSKFAAATGGTLVKECQQALASSNVSDSLKSSLTEHLDTAEVAFHLRNQYLHGYWIYDDESQQWLTLKGARGLKRPEMTFTDGAAVWKLAAQLDGLCSRLLEWDIAVFGEISAAEEDQGRGRASVKRL
ncbi:hypothetical protein ACGFZA_07995 [Streptomyces sp. NPDC048211]|uniref:hypothetical protein n=1 Tax=Streptomyces sp. NPDC048211 TaxID=3365516 RepID=UPI0037218992